MLCRVSKLPTAAVAGWTNSELAGSTLSPTTAQLLNGSMPAAAADVLPAFALPSPLTASGRPAWA